MVLLALVKAVLNQTKPVENPEDLERQGRTCIVKKPRDENIKNSRDIRKAMNIKYKEVVLRQARNTVGGSILLEFENATAADNIIAAWDKQLFGGNEGIVKLTPRHTAGIIKQVEDRDEELIKNEIVAQFPGSHIELFKKAERFTGTVKIIFKDEDTLNKAMEAKCKLNNQIYIVEVFNPKPRVIKCNICQRFGHVSRVCKHKDSPLCGKCSSTNHETKDCTAEEKDYKCAHCSENHVTGSYVCEKVKEKLDELLSRNNIQ